MVAPALDFEHVFEEGLRDAAFTLLLLHGTGADQHDLLPLGRRVAPGAPLLSPLGKVRENGMPRWFRRLEMGMFDEEDLQRRAADLADFLPKAAARYGVDPRRLVALGFSNGANIAGALLLLHPRALKGAVLLRPMTPLVPREPPDLSGVPVLLRAGERDPMVPREDVRRLAHLLEKAGADVELRWADAGHELLPDEVAQVRVWLDETVA